MKHRLKSIKLGKDSKHRKALLRNLSTALLRHERITTTEVKAKQLRSFVEKIITRAKTDSLHHRRLVYRHLKDRSVLKKLFENIGVRYQNRKGGYTRIYKLPSRKGDDARMAIIELVAQQIESDKKTEASVDTADTSLMPSTKSDKASKNKHANADNKKAHEDPSHKPSSSTASHEDRSQTHLSKN